MAALQLSILAIILLSFQLYAAAAPLGDWIPIRADKLADPTVVRIAEFAVMNYSQRAESRFDYKFVRVIKGDTQLFAGTKYRLLIESSNVEERGPANLLAIVYAEPRGNVLKLLSLKRLLA